MRTVEITPLKGHELFGASFAICTDVETLGIEGDGTPYTDADIAEMVADGAGKVIVDAGFDYEADSYYSNWNGGRRRQFATMPHGYVVAYIYHRELEPAEEGEEPEHGEWNSCLKAQEIPTEVTSMVSQIIDAAEDSIQAVRDAVESSARPVEAAD